MVDLWLTLYQRRVREAEHHRRTWMVTMALQGRWDELLALAKEPHGRNSV